MDLIITILPVVTKDLPISPRFTPYNFFIAMQVQHSYNSRSYYLVHRSIVFAYVSVCGVTSVYVPSIITKTVVPIEVFVEE